MTLDTPRSEREPERPQYVRIGDILRERIRVGQYAVGSLLPTEGELCEEFSISRHTVREALRRLAEEGLIQRRQGSGSRVMMAEAHKNYVHSMRSLDQLFQYASDTRFVISTIASEPPPPALFPDGVPTGIPPWLTVHAIRMEGAEDVPICASTVYVNSAFSAIAPRLKEISGAIYGAIEEQFSVEMSEVIQDIAVVTMPADAAEALGVQPKSWAVKVSRRYLDAEGDLMLASINYHPADRFSYSMQMRREAWGPT